MNADQQDVEATFGLTPSFVPRSNTQGDYGDNFQDFWMTATQRDFSGGQDQRHFRGDEERSSRFWSGAAVDVSVPGEARLRKSLSSTTTGTNPTNVMKKVATGPSGSVKFATTLNLYNYANDDTITNHGAHSLGSSPTALISDGTNTFLSVGTQSVRKWDGSAFSTFSANGCDVLAVLNNTLYGYRLSTDDLVRYDSAGTLSSLYTWRDVDGDAVGSSVFLEPFGGKLAILRTSYEGRSELWLFDGVAPSMLHRFEQGFTHLSLAVAHGVIFVGGRTTSSTSGGTTNEKQAIWGWKNGAVVRLWTSRDTTSTILGMLTSPHPDGLLFYANKGAGSTGWHLFSMETGAVAHVATNTFTPLGVAAGDGYYVSIGSVTDLDRFPTITTATTGSITTSLFDFDSSKTKIFRGISVDFDAGTDGNGGTVDIAYRVGDVVGSYTTLQTGATSGTEYNLSGITGRYISVKVTLNKGTSTDGPVLKRIHVRAVPQQTAFRKVTVALLCTGRDGKNHVQLRNGEIEPSDGLTLATALNTAATSATPIAITDAFGTLSAAVIEELQLQQVRPHEFLAFVTYRQV